jgi:DNA-directed RNA polymerase subunit M/transcription elongation factor TFIIS
VPDIKNVKHIMIPDLDAIFVGMKSATSNGKAELDRNCPKCNHENTYELDCNALLDTIVFVDVNDTFIKFGDNLTVSVRPYNVEMRQMFIKREFEEEKLIRALDLNKEMDELEKARILGESVDRIAQLTFNLVSKSIEKIVIHNQNITVTDPTHIEEWLIGITKAESDIVIDTVNKLNKAGIIKEMTVTCQSCNHQWDEQLSFDPTSFFGKR